MDKDRNLSSQQSAFESIQLNRATLTIMHQHMTTFNIASLPYPFQLSLILLHNFVFIHTFHKDVLCLINHMMLCFKIQSTLSSHTLHSPDRITGDVLDISESLYSYIRQTSVPSRYFTKHFQAQSFVSASCAQTTLSHSLSLSLSHTQHGAKPTPSDILFKHYINSCASQCIISLWGFRPFEQHLNKDFYQSEVSISLTYQSLNTI